MLEHLDRANLFLVPLDGTRRWYRYHHLFAEVLGTHLLDGRPEEVADLHRRASRWYDEAGEPVPAVRHAVAAGDIDRAADLAELAVPALQRDRQEATIAAWLAVIPDEVVQTRPVLAFGFIAALMSSGQFTGVEERIHDLEQHLPTNGPDGQASGPPPGTIVVDRNTWDRLPAALELHRSALSLIHGDPAAAIAHADRATSIAAADDHLTRAGAAATAGLARWAGGDLEEAHRSYATCVEGLRRDGHISDVLGCSITLADIRITQGRLTDALADLPGRAAPRRRRPAPGDAGNRRHARRHQRCRVRTQRPGHRGPPPAAEPRARRRRRSATEPLPAGAPPRRACSQRRETCPRQSRSSMRPSRCTSGTSPRTCAPSPRGAPGYTSLVETWPPRHRGRATRDLAADDELTYMREFEHITLAMVLLAQHRAGHSPAAAHVARRLLERLLAAAEAGGRMGNVIEILVQLALASEAEGDRSRATDLLGRALALGEPEGHIRVFLDAGPTLSAVLHSLGPDSPGGQHARAVLAAGEQNPTRPSQPASSAPAAVTTQPLVDSLSERELDVLRLLDSDLGGPDIARELSVSVNTVRTHTRHIYAKLGVTNRREAVREAARLGLLRRPSR